MLGEALSTRLAEPDASGARPVRPFHVRLGFHRRSVGRGLPSWWRRPSGSPSRPDVEPAPGVAVGFTSTTLLPVEAAPPAPGEPSCVRDGLQRPGTGQVSVLRTEILGTAKTSPTPPYRPDHRRDLRQRLGREHGAHLMVTRLVPPDIRNGPEFSKEPGVITVDGERLTVEPFDLAVAPGDDGKPFGVGLDPEAIWLGKRTELLSSALLLRELSPTCSRDHRVATHASGNQRRACQDHRPSDAVAQVPSDKVLSSAKGRSAPLPAVRESAVFRSAPLRSTAVRFRRAPRRLRSGRSLVGPIHASERLRSATHVTAPAGDRTWQESRLVTPQWLGDRRRPRSLRRSTRYRR